MIPFGKEQRDIFIDQSNSFSTLHHTYSAVHQQGLALEMVPVVKSTNGRAIAVHPLTLLTAFSRSFTITSICILCLFATHK
jgi:hypothetical protein